jgi:hypothetical protein
VLSVRIPYLISRVGDPGTSIFTRYGLTDRIFFIPDPDSVPYPDPTPQNQLNTSARYRTLQKFFGIHLAFFSKLAY